MSEILFLVLGLFIALQGNQVESNQNDFHDDPTHISLRNKLIELNKQLDNLEYEARYIKMNISDSRELIYATLLTHKSIVDLKIKIKANFPHIRHLDGCYYLLQTEINNYTDKLEYLYYSRFKQYITALKVVFPLLRNELEPNGTDERFLCELNKKNCKDAGYNMTYLNEVSGNIKTYRKHFDSMANYYVHPSRFLHSEAYIAKQVIEPVMKCYVSGQPKPPVFLEE